MRKSARGSPFVKIFLAFFLDSAYFLRVAGRGDLGQSTEGFPAESDGSD
jgi:hypothetical protein